MEWGVARTAMFQRLRKEPLERRRQDKRNPSGARPSTLTFFFQCVYRRKRGEIEGVGALISLRNTFMPSMTRAKKRRA